MQARALAALEAAEAEAAAEEEQAANASPLGPTRPRPPHQRLCPFAWPQLAPYLATPTEELTQAALDLISVLITLLCPLWCCRA